MDKQGSNEKSNSAEKLTMGALFRSWLMFAAITVTISFGVLMAVGFVIGHVCTSLGQLDWIIPISSRVGTYLAFVVYPFGSFVGYAIMTRHLVKKHVRMASKG